MEQGWAKEFIAPSPALRCLKTPHGVRCLLSSKLQNWKLQGRSRVVEPSAFYSDKECRVYILNEHQISMHDRDNDEHEAANGSVFYLLNDSEVESNSSKLVRVTLKAYLNEILSIRHVNSKPLNAKSNPGPATLEYLQASRRRNETMSSLRKKSLIEKILYIYSLNKTPLKEKRLDLPTPGLLPVRKIIEDPQGDKGITILANHSSITLQRVFLYFSDVLFGSRDSRCKTHVSDAHLKYIAYQILRGVEHFHGIGVPHGGLKPSTIVIDQGASWIMLSPPVNIQLEKRKDFVENDDDVGDDFIPQFPFYNTGNFLKVGGRLPASFRLESFTSLWVNGQISNLEYLMLINKNAGRDFGSDKYAPVLPWVTDFSNNEDFYEQADEKFPWRDLTKSKFRLKKGDDQLQRTYTHGMPPHHIPENLTDITYYVYLARITPRKVLQSIIRANFNSNEYPCNVENLYAWTPDECIVEMYTDPSIFKSIHNDMPDLDIPLPRTQIDSSEIHENKYVHFVKRHRELLESDYVSSNLHHWIDLNFGYKLKGEAAIESMNVTLPIAGADFTAPLTHGAGFVQLFKKKHPKKTALKSFMNVNLIERSDAEDNPSRVLFNTPTSSRGSIASPEVSNARVSVAVKGMDFNTSSDTIFRNSLLGKHSPNYASKQPPRRTNKIDWEMLKRSPSIKLPMSPDALSLDTYIQRNETQNQIELHNQSAFSYVDAIYYPPLDLELPTTEPFGYDTKADCHQGLISRDIFAIGCLLGQLFMPSFRPLFDRKHLRQFLLTLKQGDVADINMGKFIPEWQKLPLSIQRAVKEILLIRPGVSSILSDIDLFEKGFPYKSLYEYHSRWYEVETIEPTNDVWLKRAKLVKLYFPIFLSAPSPKKHAQDSLDKHSKRVIEIVLPTYLDLFASKNVECIRVAIHYFNQVVDLVGVDVVFAHIVHVVESLIRYLELLDDKSHFGQWDILEEFMKFSFVYSILGNLGRLTLLDVYVPMLIDVLYIDSGQTNALPKAGTSSVVEAQNMDTNATSTGAAKSTGISYKKNVFNKCKSQACESLFQLSSPGALGSEISTSYLVPLVVEKVGQPKMGLTLAPECILGIARRIGEDATCKHIVNPLLKKLYKPILLSKVGNKRYRVALMEIIETLKLLMKVVHKDRIMPRVKSFVSHAAQTYRDDIVNDIFSAVDFNIYGDDEEDNNNTVVKTRSKPRSSVSHHGNVGSASQGSHEEPSSPSKHGTYYPQHRSTLSLELLPIDVENGAYIGMSRQERIKRDQQIKLQKESEKELRRKDSRLTNRLINRHRSYSRQMSYTRDEGPNMGQNDAYESESKDVEEFKVAKFNSGKGEKLGHVTAIAKNRDESMLLIGNSNGMVASYSLGNGEPLFSNEISVGNKPIKKIIIYDHFAAVHNGGLHLWDIDKGRFVTRMYSKNRVAFTDISGWDFSPKCVTASTTLGTIACIDFRENNSKICYEWSVSASKHKSDYLSCIGLFKKHYILVGTSSNEVFTLDQRTGRILNKFHGGRHGIQQVFASSLNFTLANKDPGLHVLPGASNTLYGFHNGKFASTWMNVDFDKQKCVFIDSTNFPFTNKMDANSLNSHMDGAPMEEDKVLQTLNSGSFSSEIECSSFLPLSRVVLAGNSDGLWSIKI